jgi:hypothetical protein
VSAGAPHTGGPRRRPKLFRDPVHDVIAMDPSDPSDALALRLLDTKEVQRLRRVRQLGLTSLVFHGAEHSRFAHSLGVFHVARRILDVLGREWPITPDERRLVLAAGLLHDVGHGPFSHAAERAFGFVHEDWSRAILTDGDTEVGAVLRQADPQLHAAIAGFIAHRPIAARHLADVVSSQLDADRLDYLLRDGAATGVGYTYDLPRIVEAMEVDPASQRLVVGYRGHDAVEGYLLTRHHMYRNLYFHKTTRAASAMLLAALRRARVLAASNELPVEGLPRALLCFIRGDAVTVTEYLDLDDGDVWRALKLWRSARDPLIARLATGLLDRRLYKTIDVTDLAPAQRARLQERAAALLLAGGQDPAYALLQDETRGKPYQPYAGAATLDPHGEAAIFVRGPDGVIREIAETSATVRALAAADVAVRWCVPPEFRREVLAISQELALGAG